METFLSIDWNPSINDILDNEFINEERLVQESVMYRILRGTFTNPFDNMEDEYRAVDAETIMSEQNIKTGNKINLTKNTSSSNVSEQETKDKKPNYVPGIIKPPYQFPRMSDLSKKEQAICLRILLKFSGSEKPDLTDEDRGDLQTYLRLKDTINEEQDKYLEFVKGKWDGSGLKIYCEDYINLKWKYKLQNILKLPRYYIESTNIPFVSHKEISVQYISTCLENGYAPIIKLPDLTKPYILRVNSTNLEEKFSISNEYSNHSNMNFKLPVSKDPTCESLAEANEVDLVISSSGLNCFANNVGPNYTKTWLLPVVVKSQNGKNVIYIDKPAPPTCNTVPEKNTWVYKYILRHAMIQLRSATSKRSNNIKVYDDNLFGNIHSENHINLENNYEIASETLNKTKVESKNVDEPSISNENEDLDVLVVKEDACNFDELFGEEDDTSEKINNDMKRYHDNCISYKLFRIGSSSTEQNELMKNTIKDYKILVRTKEDGYEKLTKTTIQKLLLVPKLEHQLALGAEAVTLEEALKQWISLVFRPATCLARIRISAQSSEVIQVEKRTTVSINNEIKRLYNVKAEDSLNVLYNVIQTLSNVNPGRYIIRHTLRNGAFATVYKESDNTGKNVLDLHAIFGHSQYHTIPNPPWPMLDKVVTTPMHKCFQRMPLMFYAPKVSNKRKYKQKNNPSTSQST